MKHEAIPENRQNFDTYGRILFNRLPPKYNLYHTKLTVEGNLVKYQGDVSTRMVDLTTKNRW